jgi:hypothetical protein
MKERKECTKDCISSPRSLFPVLPPQYVGGDVVIGVVTVGVIYLYINHK